MITKIVRVVLIVLLMAVIGFAIWTKTTRRGGEVLRRLQIMVHGGEAGGDEDDAQRGDESRREPLDPNRAAEAREAAEKLKAMHCRLGTLPPDPTCISIDCNNLSLGDEGFRLIGKCFQLQALSVIDTDVNDDRMKNLSGLTQLNSLSVIKTPARKDAGTVTGAGLQCLASMPRLVGLLLKGTDVGDEGLKQVGRLPELATLDLTATRVTDAGLLALTGLKKLQWLVLIDTAVTDDGVAKLTGMSSLKKINVRGTKVTAKGKARLLQMYPDLRID